jgi:hypothetical protein
MWICDCRVLSRGHRKNILTTTAPEIGVGIVVKGTSVYATTNGVNAGFGAGYACKVAEMGARGSCNFAAVGASEDLAGTLKCVPRLLNVVTPGAAPAPVALAPAAPVIAGLDFEGIPFSEAKADGSKVCPKTFCPCRATATLKPFFRVPGFRCTPGVGIFAAYK